MMTRWVSAGCRALLGLSLLGLVGCGEDNEEASRAQAAKSTGLINPLENHSRSSESSRVLQEQSWVESGSDGCGPERGESDDRCRCNSPGEKAIMNSLLG